MNFRLWLETDEGQPHPLETWVNDYKSAHEAERNHRSNYAYRNYRNMPQMPLPKVGTKALMQDPRITKDRWYVVRVIDVDGYSSGIHGYKDQPDVPAGNPAEHADWHVLIDARTEAKIRGRTAFITKYEGGSFHERWLKMTVFVIVNDIVDKEYYHDETPQEDQIEYETYGGGGYRRENFEDIVKFFKFESARQAHALIEEEESNLPSRAKEGESKDQYWRRIMKASMPNIEPNMTDTPTPYQSGYSDRDDYYKR